MDGNVRALVARVQAALEGSYLVGTGTVSRWQQAAAGEVAAALRDRKFVREHVEQMAHRFFAEGQLDRPTLYSALSVVAAHPRVRDWPAALRWAALEEYAALEGGVDVERHLAAADRHRGTVALRMGRPEAALDAFQRALRHERTAENLGNVLAALLALGERETAEDIWSDVESTFPAAIHAQLELIIALDDDLAALRFH